MKKIFILQHVSRENTNDEDVKFIGVFSSKQKALACVAKTKKLKGFKRYPNGFHIDKYELNKANWSEGFSTICKTGSDGGGNANDSGHKANARRR